MSVKQAHVKNYLVGLTVMLSILIAGCEEPETTAPVIRPVLAIKVGDVSTLGTRLFPGRAQAVQSANLSFEVSGALIERPVNVGDVVAKGQLIASIDPVDYSSRLKAAKAEVIKSKANFKRAKELIKKDHISKQDYDRLQAAYEVDVANMETASKALKDTKLTAPFNGRIAKLFVENFQVVQAKQQIARLVDASSIEMIVQIPEVLISVVPDIQHVLLRFDAAPDREFSATVKEIGAEASRTTRTYPVTLAMKQPEDITILPGMAGEARADPATIKEALLDKKIELPTSAVFSPDASNDSFVWVVDEKTGIVSRRGVTTGAVKSTGLVIEKGLAVGEWVAVAGIHRLSDGQKVRLQPAQGE